MDEEFEIEKIEPTKKRKILMERAAAIAMPPLKEVDNGIEIDGLGFMLADDLYLVEAVLVVEVILLRELTPLPCCPPFILGIINLRGRILSVINLKTFLNLPEKGITNLNRVIIVKHKNIEVGLLVDEVIGKIPFAMDQLLTAMPTLSSKQKEYLIGVTKNRAVVFDIKKFLSDEIIVINEEA